MEILTFENKREEVMSAFRKEIDVGYVTLTIQGYNATKTGAS